MNNTKNGFKLGHVYDVTSYVKKEYNVNAGYTKFYVSNDVWDFHIYRIIEGFNSEYEEEPRTKLIEQTDIHKREVLEEMEPELGMLFSGDIRNFPDKTFENETTDDWMKAIIKIIIDLDDGENEDVLEYRYDTPIETLIRDIDGGYGITVLDAELNVTK